MMLTNPGKKAWGKECKLKTEVCLLLSICYAGVPSHKLKSLLGGTQYYSPERPSIVSGDLMKEPLILLADMILLELVQ